MRFRRAAPDTRVLELFEESAGNARRAGETLQELLADYPEQRHLTRELLKQEQHGDRLAHDIIHRLNENGIRLPYESADLYELARALDDVVDYAEQTADQLGLYGVEAPMAQAQELAKVLAAAAAEMAAGIETLRTHADLSGHLVRVHELENEGDRLSREAIASLFAKGIDPMVVIRWKDIFESLEQAIDSCETVAHILEGVSIKAGRR
ncbi:MAG: uncharacterized protein QOK25_534 [Thermoleophilaceae bacterium]|nr:uncharacterized protein [Thermoleophilaceae bacterium]